MSEKFAGLWTLNDLIGMDGTHGEPTPQFVLSTKTFQFQHVENQHTKELKYKQVNA